MSWRVRVVHTTGYRYEAPVVQSYNEARLTPRGDRRQNVVVSRVETTPATRAYRYTDYWGTEVTSFDLHAPHKELKVVASSVVETSAEIEPVTTGTWGDVRADNLVDRYTEFLEPTRYTPRDRELLAVARELKKGQSPSDAVLAASQWVWEQLKYQPGSTGVHSSAVDAWQERKGVCQDFAHLTLVLLRGMGIPARYVSGYLHTKKDGGPLFTSVATVPGQALARMLDAASRRDFIYLVFFLALFGKSNWFLVMAAVGAPIFFLLLVFLAMRERFQRQPNAARRA